jgi:hypothetical protein
MGRFLHACDARISSTNLFYGEGQGPGVPSSKADVTDTCLRANESACSDLLRETLNRGCLLQAPEPLRKLPKYSRHSRHRECLGDIVYRSGLKASRLVPQVLYAPICADWARDSRPCLAILTPADIELLRCQEHLFACKGDIGIGPDSRVCYGIDKSLSRDILHQDSNASS